MNSNPNMFRASPTPVLETRRQWLTSIATATAAGLLLPRRLFSQQTPTSPVIVMRKAAADASIATTRLRESLSLLEGSGGNITVLTGPDGLLLVDAGMTASQSRIAEALAKLSADPVRLVVNTHWHFDHTDGNEWLQRAGARIVAHTNTVRRLSTRVRVEGWSFTFEPSPGAAVPTVHFERELRLRANGQNVTLKSYAPGHTDTDLSVYFEEADVLCVGDTWWNGHFPFIDYSTGGSIDGTIQAAEENLRRATSSTLVVPGHGPAGGLAELRVYRDMLMDVRERVSKLKRQGRPLAETIAARPTQQYDAAWGGFVIDPATFTTLVYQGV